MIGHVVTDLIDQSTTQIRELAPESIEDVRAAAQPAIGFSSVVFAKHMALKDFLRDNLYRHEQVKKMNDETQVIVERLFEIYMGDSNRMPAAFGQQAGAASETERARIVADYIAGMTDRFAIAEYERLS